MFPAISVNKDVTVISSCSLLALRKLRKEKNNCPLAALRLQPLPALSLRKLGTCEYKRAEVHIRGMISGSPDSGSFPFVKKVPNSSNWSIWFSLNNSNLLVFWTIPFVAKSLYILAPLLPPLSTLAELRWCLTGCSPHLASDKALTLCVFS